MKKEGREKKDIDKGGRKKKGKGKKQGCLSSRKKGRS